MALVHLEKLRDLVFSGLANESVKAKKPVAGLTDAITSINSASGSAGHSTHIYAKELGGTVKALGSAAAGVVGFKKALDELSKYTLEAEDATKMAMRGTTLMVQGLTKNYKTVVNETKAFGTSLQGNLRIPFQESIKLAVGIKDTYTKANRAFAMSGTTVEKYSQALAIAAKITGASTDDLLKSQQVFVLGLNQGVTESIGLTKGLTAATMTFGISGQKAINAVETRVEELQMLDVEDREEYADKVILAAGIQEKAARDFGKYTDNLTKSTGSNSLKQAATLGSLTHTKTENVLALMQKARFDAQAKLQLNDLKRQAIENISPDFVDKQKKALKGTLKTDEVVKHAGQQEAVAKILESFGDTIDSFMSGIEATDRGKEAVTAVDDYKKNKDSVDKVDNFKGAMDAMGTAEEEKERLEAVTRNALEPLNAFNELIKTINAHLGTTVSALNSVIGGLGSLFLAVRGLTSLLGLGAGGGAAAAAGGGGAAAGGAAAAAGAASKLGTLNKWGGRAGTAALALDAGIGAYRLYNDREGLRNETQDQQDQARNGLMGHLKNFGSNFMRPGQAVARTILGTYDTVNAYSEGNESQRRADQFEEQAKALKKAQLDAFKKGDYLGLRQGAKSINAKTLHNATILIGKKLAGAGLTPDYNIIKNKVYDQFMSTGSIKPDDVFNTLSQTWKTKSDSAESALKAFEDSTEKSLQSLYDHGLDTSGFSLPSSQIEPITDKPIILNKTQGSVSIDSGDDTPKATANKSANPNIGQANPPSSSDKKLEKLAALLSEQNDLLRALSVRTGFVS